MGMTITEKILARHTEKGKVVPGEFIYARVDLVLGNDITAPLAIAEFRKIGVERVFDQDKVALVPDHFAPNKDIKSATQCKIMREFAQEQQISNYFEVGEMGIEHALLPEKGLVLPGDLVVGADSHTCTYGALGAFSTGVGSTDMAVAMATGELWFKVPPSMKFVLEGKLEKWVSGKDLILYIIGLIGVDGALYRAMEFTGPVIRKLSMDSRMTMANMVVEAGAESGIIEPDQLTLDYIAERAKRDYQIYKSDPDAQYWKVIEIDVTEIEPQVAFPHLPSNTRPISQVERIQIQQAVIGSCTNGRLEELRIAAQILKGHKVAKGVRLIVIPATQDIYRQALKEGLLEIFVDSGAVISTPTCGPCLGGHMGVLAEGEKAVSTTNRNFVGRMGHPESQVYLANPAVAAASAVAGYIISPEEVEGMG
ncbi:3-isopropylmalate/(R)-2-methylmalate dehydratase large subunit [Candidatus Hakubella thermalkaliphila]|uniref:3-isopropylmalate dehydratase large subunit n=1 Tax=Candidatus Hakubella thermalkaliphila TaxID=2754717 RepID=A0A6V8NT44_9ACTN|nr:3-isopropylmalate/(R)-2-methylmalate dehydratase large subunit [Candidatus Hakubella thermalkaliphila]